MTVAPVIALRRFIRTRKPKERCDTCGAALPAEHAHTFDAHARRIRCACKSCEILHATFYRLIPRKTRVLVDFQITDAQWDQLMIPISLAYFSYSTEAARVIAMYPGPAGATESLLPLNTWEEIAAQNCALREMQPDVEALLAYRVGAAREYFIVPVDECYRLVGLIRLHWRGLSGGAAVWGEIGSFFQALGRKGSPCPA